MVEYSGFADGIVHGTILSVERLPRQDEPLGEGDDDRLVELVDPGAKLFQAGRTHVLGSSPLGVYIQTSHIGSSPVFTC